MPSRVRRRTRSRRRGGVFSPRLARRLPAQTRRPLRLPARFFRSWSKRGDFSRAGRFRLSTTTYPTNPLDPQDFARQVDRHHFVERHGVPKLALVAGLETAPNLKCLRDLTRLSSLCSIQERRLFWGRGRLGCMVGALGSALSPRGRCEGPAGVRVECRAITHPRARVRPFERSQRNGGTPIGR